MLTLPMPQLEFASTNPATMKMSGPVKLWRANQSDRIAHPKMTIDKLARAASFICRVQASRISLPWAVSQTIRCGVAGRLIGLACHGSCPSDASDCMDPS